MFWCPYKVSLVETAIWRHRDNSWWYAMSNRCVFSCFRKLLAEVAECMWTVRSFHSEEQRHGMPWRPIASWTGRRRVNPLHWNAMFERCVVDDEIGKINWLYMNPYLECECCYLVDDSLIGSQWNHFHRPGLGARYGAVHTTCASAFWTRWRQSMFDSVTP